MGLQVACSISSKSQQGLGNPQACANAPIYYTWPAPDRSDLEPFGEFYHGRQVRPLTPSAVQQHSAWKVLSHLSSQPRLDTWSANALTGKCLVAARREPSL